MSRIRRPVLISHVDGVLYPFSRQLVVEAPGNDHDIGGRPPLTEAARCSSKTMSALAPYIIGAQARGNELEQGFADVRNEGDAPFVAARRRALPLEEHLDGGVRPLLRNLPRPLHGRFDQFPSERFDQFRRESPYRFLHLESDRFVVERPLLDPVGHPGVGVVYTKGQRGRLRAYTPIKRTILSKIRELPRRCVLRPKTTLSKNLFKPVVSWIDS